MQWLKILWLKAFPVRIVLLDRPVRVDRPDIYDDAGEPLGMDDLLPELLEAYKTSPAVFAWIEREIAKKDKLYHELAPPEGEAREVWRRKMEGLNAQLSVLNRAARLPLLANKRIRHLQEQVESKKANEAERKVIENFFAE